MKVDSTGITHNPYAAKGRWLKGSIHCHTIESDGSCTPRQIIDWCTENGYRFLAITDHNKITVGLTMRHFVRHHSAKNIDVRFWFPTLVCRFKRL
jgi:hypothetical protein